MYALVAVFSMFIGAVSTGILYTRLYIKRLQDAHKETIKKVVMSTYDQAFETGFVYARRCPDLELSAFAKMRDLFTDPRKKK